MKYSRTLMKTLLVSAGATCMVLSNARAESGGHWFLRPLVGLSLVSDFQATANNVAGSTGPAEIKLDNGFTAGLGAGYRYNANIAVEIAWEYRSNDSEVLLNGATPLRDGNYASNTFYLNGHYYFSNSGKWEPYVGAGLSWVQEIDLDFEQNGVESSYTSDGDVGYQVFAGLNYDLSPSWDLQSELRYGSITDITLKSEAANGDSFTGMDYQPFTVQLGLVYQF